MKKFRRKVLDMLMSNNSGSSLRQQLLDGAPFRSSLLYTAVPQRAASGTTGTFTRATTSTWPNNDGYLVTGVAGEIGFPGARRVRNYISASSEDFSNAAWTKLSMTVVVNQAAAPNGTLTADLLQPGSSGTDRAIYQNGLVSSVVGNKMILEIYAKYAGIQWLWFGTLNGGTGPTSVVASFDIQNGVVGQTGSYFSSSAIEDIGDGWYRCSAIATISVAPLYPVYGLADADGSTTVTASGSNGIYLWGAQVEDVTAQTTQTAGEYVSVGVPSDWQGTELVTNGTFDSGTDWTTGAGLSIAGGRLVCTASAAASQGTGFSVVSGTKYAVSWVVPSYTSGSSRVLIRKADSTVIGGGSQNTTAVTAAGLYVREFTSDFTGTVYPNAEFPTSGTSTMDNISVKPAYYHGSFVDGVKCFATDLSGNPIPSTTMLGYQAQGARTNLCLQSQTFGTTWSPNVTTVSSNAAVAPDGTTTADLVYPNSTGVNRYIGQSGLTTTAATWTFSFYAKYAGAGGWAYCIDLTGSSVVAYFDIQNGAVGTVSAGHSASIEDAGNGWYRCSLITTTAPAGAANVYIGNADVNGATTITANGTNGIYLWGAQVELGSFASSYIPTTTIAVTRNVDALTYSSAGNTSASAGWVYVEATVPINNSAPQIQIDDGSSNNRIMIDDGGATNGGTRFFIQSGGAVQANIVDFSSSANIVQKRCATWAANYAQSSQGGLLSAADTSVTTPVSFTQIGVGGPNGAAVAPCTIRNVRIGQRQLSASELGAITS